MRLEFIDLISALAVTVNYENQKAIEKMEQNFASKINSK